MGVQRISMFKVPDEANFQPMKDAYKVLSETNEKDGKPYILEVKGGPSLSGDRGKGYTFIGMTRFKDMEDMRYYDEKCEAHKKFKSVAQHLVEQPVQPPLTAFFEEHGSKATTIQRISLFKVIDEANVQPMIDGYNKLFQTNERDGKPFVLEMKARASLSGDRGKGYNFVGTTRFKDMEDVRCYDEQCKAHKTFKEECIYVMVENPPPLTVFFED